MSRPTRTRTSDDSTGAAVVKAGDTSPAVPAQTLRPYVFRDVVDRRGNERRAEDRAVSHGTPRAPAQGDPRDLMRLDPALREHVDAELERAMAEGYAAGYSQARQETLERTDAIGAAIGLAAAELVDFSASEKAAAVNSVIELAERVATVVMNRTPHDGGEAALRRIREVLEGLDDAPFTIAVHPDDLDTVAAGVNNHEVMVAPDPTLQPGEARIKGVWSYSDLTQAAAWEAVRTALAL